MMREIKAEELMLSPCPVNFDHKLHIWAVDREILSSNDLYRPYVDVHDNLRMCPGLERERTDEEKREAAKHAMVVLSWMSCFAAFWIGVALLVYTVIF